MECAGTNTIAALLAGAADPAAAERLELHLDACPSCRRLVADLGRGLSAIGDGPAAHADRLPQPGETIGRYEIKRVVGVGGMGVVYEAHDTTLDRRVAVKLLRPDLLEGTSLLAEAKAMARLQHPNIATVHDAGIASGQLYVCMEYVAGSTLRAWVAARSRDWREIVDVYADAGEGLAYVHRAGLVHLDFKPDNVLVDSDGRVLVTDFGLARIVGARPPHGGRMIVGTPAYMAPEQRLGGVTDARSDQYSFCVALREALATAHSPRWLGSLIERGLAEHPDDRFASMEELLAALAVGRARGPRRAARAGVVAFASLVALAVSSLPNPTRVITHYIDRPVAHVVTTYKDAGAEAAGAAEPSAFATTASAPAPSSAPAAARGYVIARRAPTLQLEPVTLATSALPTSARVADGSPDHGDAAEPGLCDDGSVRSCTWWAPSCPAGTMLSVQQSCWTCADEQSCGSLGFPRTCNDGTPLRCNKEAPTCSGRRVAAVRNGCWSCEDPFTCWSHSQPQLAPPRRARCGNRVCERGESERSCVTDCAATASGSNGGSNGGSNSGSGGSGGSGEGSCGNGFCEVGEDHATCASDCCETDPSGACLAVCGNGFCEAGEDHAACASDCCEMTASGACVPVCGNGFCEDGETVESCPSECS